MRANNQEQLMLDEKELLRSRVEKYLIHGPLGMRRNIIICDIDHTIANSFHRDGMMAAPMGAAASWDDYHRASVMDEPLHDMVCMINALVSNGYYVICVTARPGKWRKLTMDWLIKHNVFFHELLMRPDDSYHPAPEIKLKLVHERIKQPRDEVAFVIDDREDIAAAFKGIGVTVLQVHGRQK